MRSPAATSAFAAVKRLINWYIGAKHTDNCKTVIFDKDILSSPSDSSHLYGQVIEKQADLVFVIACLGGCFGTETTPLFVKESLKAGKRTIGIVTLPFQQEGDMTHDKSLDALRKIAANTDSMFILNNHYLEKHHNAILRSFKSCFKSAMLPMRSKVF